MHNRPPTGSPGLQTTWRSRRRNLAIPAILFLFIQPACLFHKKKAAVPEAVPAAPTRVVLLPFDLPAGNTELRWVALAAPVLMAKTMETSPDLEVVPIWQTMPIAVEAAGQSRELTPEVAAYVASRLAAKWAVDGQLAPGKDGVALTVDFIPAKATMIAFRYQKNGRADALGDQYHEAVRQFLDYLVARPLGKSGARLPDAGSQKELAEALDREYGWYADASPGKAETIVANLIRTDATLARLLFNPGLYPGLGSVAPKPKPIDLTPVPPPPPETKPAPETSQPSGGQTQPPAPPPESRPEERSAISPPAPTGSPPPEHSASDTSIAGASERQTDDPDISRPQPALQNYRISTAGQAAANPNPPPPQGRPRDIPEHAQAGPGGAETAFTVQVTAARDKEEVEAEARRLEKSGFATRTEQVNLKDKGTWYRLRLVGYESRSEAKRAADKLVSAGVIKKYWIP